MDGCWSKVGCVDLSTDDCSSREQGEARRFAGAGQKQLSVRSGFQIPESELGTRACTKLAVQPAATALVCATQ